MDDVLKKTMNHCQCESLFEFYVKQVVIHDRSEQLSICCLAIWMENTTLDAESILKRCMRESKLNENEIRKNLATKFYQLIIYYQQLEYFLDQLNQKCKFNSSLFEPRNNSFQHPSILTQPQSTLHAIQLAAIYHYIHNFNENSMKRSGYLMEEQVQFWNEVSASLCIEFPQETSAQLSIVYSLPLWLVNQWIVQFGVENTAEICHLCNLPGSLTLRMNVLRGISASSYVECLLQHEISATVCQFSPWGVRVETKVRGGAWALPEWSNGAFEIQDEGSQIIAFACGVQQGESVLDYCCGTGNKSLALAGMVGSQGQVYCWDINKAVLGHVLGNAKRASAENIIRIVPDQIIHHEAVDQKCALLVDCVLVDAPCSGAGQLRRHPSHRWNRLNESEARYTFPQLQTEIVRKASRFVKPGGSLVYATCSLLDWENTEVASKLDDLLSTKGFERSAMELPHQFDPLLEYQTQNSPPQLQLLPNKTGTDGFFISKWKRANPN